MGLRKAVLTFFVDKKQVWSLNKIKVPKLLQRTKKKSCGLKFWEKVRERKVTFKKIGDQNLLQKCKYCPKYFQDKLVFYRKAIFG